jgi:hypothetical protein
MIFVPSVQMPQRCFFCLLLLLPTLLQAQLDTTAPTQPDLDIRYSGDLEAKIWSFKETQRNQFYKGYSVQILSASGPTALQELSVLKQTFLQKYPKVPVNEIWEAPNWKLRVGEFRSRFNAAIYRQYLLGEFPRAYVVEGELRKRSKR